MASDESTVEYRDIQGHPGYRVGSDGSVFSCWTSGRNHCMTATWHRLRLRPKRSGYLRVRIHTGLPRTMVCRLVHRLVLEAFVGPAPGGMEARHFPDRDPTNNRLDNLSWATHKENVADMAIHGTKTLGEDHPQCKLTEAEVVSIRAERAAGARCKDLAARHHVTRENITRIVARKTWVHVP